MKKILVLSFLLIAVAGVQAQKTKTLTGVVVREVFENKWSGIIIKVGSKQYGVQTSFNASAGDSMDGVKSWQTKVVGNISEGRIVRVYYRKVDNTFDYDGVSNWLTATRIVEVKKSRSPKSN